MKSKLTIFLAFFLMLSFAAFSQAPNSFKYQSMVRKADGSALANQSVKVKISILKGSTSGTSVYSEVHSTTSNAFGIVNLNIGEGSEKSGAISTIDWSLDSYFVKIEMDETGGTNYTLSSVSQLLSVPYAINANSANSIDWAKVQNKPSLFSGNYTDLTNKPDLSLYATKNEAIQSLKVSRSGDTLYLSSSNWVIIPGISAANPDKLPVIKSVSIDTVSIASGLQITFKIRVESYPPVNWLNSSFDGPNGNIYGGGSGVTFVDKGSNIWEYSKTDLISKWAPSGLYKYTNVTVENEASLTSSLWAGIVEFTYTNKFSATKPVISSIVLDTIRSLTGLDVYGKIVVNSNAPVSFLSSSFDGPNGNIHGGGSGVTFIDKGSNIWEYTWHDFISKWAPSGKYYYSNISVENEGALISEIWANEVKFNLNSSFIAQKPVIQSVNISKSSVTEGTKITGVITVNSNAPVNFFNSSFYGPNGNIHGGGSGVTFVEKSTGIWEYTWEDIISKYAPSGTYYYNNISVENEGAKQSDVWSGSLSIDIQN